MTPQEIVNQVYKLPVAQQREVLEKLTKFVSDAARVELSEDEIAQKLLAAGLIGEIPAEWNQPDENFEPLEIKGKPLSETILEDRG